MKRSIKWWSLVLLSSFLLVGGVSSLRAQDDSDDRQRAVARISLINGEVSVRRGDTGDWIAGVINAPLLTGDQVSTGPNSRAELQFDSANVLRIGGNAELHLSQLEYDRYQMELAHGTVTYNVVRSSSVNTEVDTPNLAVRPSKQGIYRISVNDAGETQVTVREGEVEVYGPRGSRWVEAGQSLLARGGTSDAEVQIVAAIPYDDWDRWNADRDRFLGSVHSYQYLPPGVYGAEDLDAYGSWDYVAPYGYCWHPTVGLAADWAPYRMGRWVWEDWYGWTWVSYDPWGWAPYHYGRWFWNAGGWWWYPGVVGRPHYWSPALVAFFGFGPGVDIGFAFGNIGWVPLAPFETFHPWWGRAYYGNRTYINQNIQITNVNITNIYRNARVANGISGLRAGDFQGGRFSNIRTIKVSQIREAGVIHGPMPLGPTVQNLRFSDRNVSRVPNVNPNVRFFSHMRPSPVSRVPFAQQQQAFAPASRAVRNSFDGSLRAEPSNGNPNRDMNGWRRFGAPAPSAPAQPPEIQQPRVRTNNGEEGNRGGWQRFGAPGQPGNPPPPARARESGRSNFGGIEGSHFAPPSERQQPLQVSPPVVRQRELFNPPPQRAPRYEPPRALSAPRSEPPAFHSAPRSVSVPAPHGGGGGHPSGGRGGSHR